MSDQALENAEKKRDELAAKINSLSQQVDELRRELRRINDFVIQWHEFAGVPLENNDAPAPRPPVPPVPPSAFPPRAPTGAGPVVDGQQRTRSTVKNPPREMVGTAAWNFMQALKRPIPRRELYEKLAAQGLVISGKDPEMVLSTMMWRMQDHFVRLPKFGYWMRNAPFGPAGYVPGLAVEDDGEDAEIAKAAKEDADAE